MKILTYNTSWEGIAGTDSTYVKGTKCVSGAPGVNQCNENIKKVLKAGDYDYMCLQEADFKLPFNFGLPGHSYKWAKVEKEVLMTFYRKGLDPEEVVSGELSKTEEKGRPFLVCVFKSFVLANIHAPHKGQGVKVLERLEEVFREKKLTHLLNRPIVVAGDFNMDIPAKMRGFCREFTSEPEHVGTCCDAYYGESGDLAYTGKYDHFLISSRLKFTEVKLAVEAKDNKLYSDHLPLAATILFEKGAGRKTRRAKSSAVFTNGRTAKASSRKSRS